MDEGSINRASGFCDGRHARYDHPRQAGAALRRQL